MRNGGIFSGPNALGLLGDSSTGSTIACVGPSFFTALQAELAKRGYKVRQDGIWDGCCQSAIIKELGAPLLYTEQVKAFLGKTCSTGYTYFGIDPGGGPLVPGPEHTVPPTCSDGSDVKGGGGTPTPSTQCPTGQVFDAFLKRCVPALDPFGCAEKCKANPVGTPQWATCMLQCNIGGGIVPQPPGPNPPLPTPPTPIEPAEEDLFGTYWPVIAGALAVAVVGGVYFATRKKTPTPAQLRANRRRRSRSRR